MKRFLSTFSIAAFCLSLAAPGVALAASSGNEVAIETLELYSPMRVGTWVVDGKGAGCRFTTDPGVTITMALDPKRFHSVLLHTQLGERCAVNTQTGTVIPFFMGTSMATPALHQ